jgi:hypothetical protein
MAPSTETGFFRHRPPVPPPETVMLTEANRYLCAAAYLVDWYGRRLTTELIDNEHRAVAPSVGVDLGLVLRHCLRSQRMLFERDALLTLVLLIGLAVTPLVGVWLGIAGGFMIGTALWARSRMLATGAGFLGGFLLVCLFGCVSAGLSRLFSGSGEPVTDLPGGSITDVLTSAGETSPSRLLVWLGLVAVFAVSVYTWWQVRVYRVLTEDLASGQRHRPPPAPPGRAGRRIAAVAAAQWGNITLHSRRGPFLGAGTVQHSWSMSLGLRYPDGTPCQIDPVELHQHVRERLLAMRGEDLPERERISGLIVVDHIVATGERKHPDPLVDPVTRVPYADASPEAIRAIIRHPQGSLRYYLRTVVGAEGRDIVEDDRLVAPAQDQEIVVSTFLYLAVEGGMLYVEFVATVLPPVLETLHEIDRIPPERVVGKALRSALARGFIGLAAAPVRLAQEISALFGTGWRMDEADRASREYRTYDYSARLSARELAADTRLRNYLQKLDAEKYYKLVERATTGAILTFLDERGVDTSEYLARSTVLLNTGVMITGGTVSGPVAAGTNATATVDGGATGAAAAPATGGASAAPVAG